MALTVNSNIQALNAYRNLNKTQSALSSSLEKLSSGLRINRASDDAAGLALSQGLKAQVGGLTQAVRNAQDGSSVVQTAEGALSTVQTILQRLRTLAVQGANDSNDTNARNAIKAESDSLVSEIDRIAKSTVFNGTQLLNTGNTLAFQVGAKGDTNSQISVQLTNLTSMVTSLSSATGAGGLSFTWDSANGVNMASFSTGTAATNPGLTFTIQSADGVTTTLTTGTAGDLADGGDGFQSMDEYVSALNNYDAFKGRLSFTVTRDANGAGNGFTVQATNGGTLTAGDNTQAKVINGSKLFTSGVAVTGSASVGLTYDSATAAQASIGKIDAQIQSISTERAKLGAASNRLNYAVDNLNVSIENLTASQSRVEDTDMASEMVQFTRAQILSQAGTSMLAQAKSLPSSVLELLRG